MTSHVIGDKTASAQLQQRARCHSYQDNLRAKTRGEKREFGLEGEGIQWSEKQTLLKGVKKNIYHQCHQLVRTIWRSIVTVPGVVKTLLWDIGRGGTRVEWADS